VVYSRPDIKAANQESPWHALCTVQDAQHQVALAKESKLEEPYLSQEEVDQIIEKYLAAVHHPSNDQFVVCDA
jgi:hypothetical protein